MERQTDATIGEEENPMHTIKNGLQFGKNTVLNKADSKAGGTVKQVWNLHCFSDFRVHMNIFIHHINK